MRYILSILMGCLNGHRISEEYNELLMVNRKTSFLRSGTDTVDEIEIFNGKDNLVTMF